MDSSSKSHDAPKDKAIRITTIVNMIPALALLIPAGVVTGNALPAVGLVPMAFSCMVSMTALGSKKEYSYVRFLVPGADFTAATFLMVLMVISWVTMASNWYIGAGKVMLSSYALVPLMINFCIHAYLALRSPSTLFQPRPCPNCNHTPASILPRWQRHVALPADSAPVTYHQPPAQTQTQGHVQTGGPGHSRSSKDIYAPFMHAYGDEARESSEFQTSGFNTPRQSVETLRSEGREERGEVVDGDRKDAGSLV